MYASISSRHVRGGPGDLQTHTIDCPSVHGAHPASPRRGAAKEIEKEGFDLIVRMVRKKEPRTFALPRDAGEECVARIARHRFQRFLAAPGQRSDVFTLQNKVESKLRRELLDKARIFSALGAKRMIEMADG